MKESIWANHGSNIFALSNNLHLSELFAILRVPRPQRFTFFGAELNPTAFAIVQIESSNVIHRTKRFLPAQSLITEKRMKQQRGRQRKHIG